MKTTLRRSILLSMMLLTLGFAVELIWGESIMTPVYAEENAPLTIYLPVTQNESRQASPETATPTVTVTPQPETPTPTTPTPEAPKVNAFFADMQWRTSSAGLATDAQGGAHLAYLYYNGLAENVPNSGVYQFCARDCDKLAQWKGVQLGEEVNEIQLALTPQGQPRLLFRTRDTNNGWLFYYASCDARCTEPERWTLTHIASNQGMAPIETNDDELPQRSFAVDGSGRPRFVYNDRASSHYGTFYTFCDANCTDKENWREVRINKDTGNSGQYRDEDLLHPVLTFSPSGQPRIVADGVTMQDEFFLFYVACDSGCDQRENWQSASLFPRGHGFEFSYDLEINSAGDPRIAFYEGAHLSGGGNVLSYAWCNDSCTQAANWQKGPLGLAILDGQEPDLELDAGGQPHLAYSLYVAGGLGYSVCSSACESTGAQWNHKVLENRTELAQASTVALPLICSGGIWDGLTPSLSLDGKGNPHIAYDATYYARCHYVGADKWEPWNEMNLVWRAVRIYLSGSGAAPGKPTVTPTVTPEPETPTPTVTPATPTVTVTPPPPPPARVGKGLFAETGWQTSSSAGAIDPQNGYHVAYVYTEALVGPDPDGNKNPTNAVYRYCQSGCDKLQNWSSVTLSEAASEVQLGLTPDGKPRLLILVRAEEGGAHADRYLYGECNTNCTSAAGWQLTPVVTVPNDLSWHWLDDPADMEDAAREEMHRRYFALDPAGRPRFVYYHYNAEVDPTGAGAYYATCDSGCTNAGNWSHTRITEVDEWSGTEWELLENPVLTFTAEGDPRMIAAMLPLGALRFAGLYYLACDQMCNERSNWHKVLVGNGDDLSGNWDMALDAAGRPYLALSSWWQEGLRYGWCDDACLESDDWHFATALTQEVDKLDLEMDTQGNPRIAYESTEYDETGNNPENRLYVLKCTGGCRTEASTWESVRIESDANVRAEWNGTIPPACAEGQWYQMTPSLAFGPNATAAIALDLQYVAKCEYNASSGQWQSGEQFTYSTVWRAARLITFP